MATGEDVLLVGASGDPIGPADEDAGRSIYELMGIAPPDDGTSCKVSCELLRPISPWGTPYRMRDEWAPFSIDQFAQRWGAGKYRFRIRTAKGTWGKQVEVVLHGEQLWERRWAEYYGANAGADAPPASRPTAPAESPLLGHVLALQAEQSKLVMTMMGQLATSQVELMKAQHGGGKGLDPFGAAASVFQLVEKARELTGDRVPAEGWGKVLEGLAPVAEAFGDAMGRALTEPDEEDDGAAAGDGERRRLKTSKGETAAKRQRDSRAAHMQALKHVRACFKKGSPALLAAELLETVHPRVAEALVSQGADGVDKAIAQLVRFAPELEKGVGRRWLELVGASLLRASVGETEPLDEACLMVSELEKVLAGEDEEDGAQENASAPTAGPKAVP